MKQLTRKQRNYLLNCKKNNSGPYTTIPTAIDKALTTCKYSTMVATYINAKAWNRIF